MGRVHPVNTAQRVVLAVGLGAALLAIGRATEVWLGGGTSGWFAYAPLTSAEAFPGAPFFIRQPGLRLLFWLSLIAVWMVVAFWLFGSRASVGDDPE